MMEEYEDGLNEINLNLIDQQLASMDSLEADFEDYEISMLLDDNHIMMN